LESHINLEIALRLEQVFHLMGYETVMIRSVDESVYTEGNTIASQKVSDLKERVRICNETKGAILVSIHQNTFPDRQYRGAQVFYGKNPDSKQLAQNVQEQMIVQLNTSGSRKAKQGSGIYLLEHITCPGILIECGFITNPVDEKLLRDDAYQKKLCAVIAATVSSYIGLDGTGST